MSRFANVLAAALAAGLASTTAFAQAPQPAKTAAPSARPTASASAAPSTSAAPSGSASSDLPPGHPPTGDLPPGHPPTDDGSQGGQANPHGNNPHGQGGRQEIFEAPPDSAEDDPSLPVGTIVLTVNDAWDKPLAKTDVTLGIVHNTVATGESRERKSATTDANGTLRWDDMPHGSGTSFRASVARDQAVFGTDPFTLGDRAGKRVVLHVYGTSTDIEETLVGTQGLVYLALREDSIVLEHLYSIFNLGSVAWVPENVTLDLPEDYKAFNRPDTMDGVGVDEVNGKGTLRGTIGPGRHDIQFRYQVPLDQAERQTIRIELPPHVAQMRVMAESTKTMGLEVPGFDPARKTKNRDGKRVLVSEKRVTRDSGGMRTLEITLTGLPTRGPGRWITIVLAALAVIGGVFYVQSRREQTGPDEELRRDLIDAREALLRELVELTRRHRAGEIGPKTYARVRGALLDALDRLVTKIQGSPPKRQQKEGPYRAADADADD